jgi:predicted membrane metal-binding protein
MVALLLLLLGAGLPAVLLWSSWSAFRVQQEQKRIYLQSRIGAIAGRLESMPRTGAAQIFELLAQEEPALAGLRIHEKRIPR